MKLHGNNISFKIIDLIFTRALLTVFILSPTIVLSEIYKWVDENGNIHFDDRPGNGNKEVIKIKTIEATSNPGTELQDNLDQEKKLLEIYQEERQGKKLKKAEQQEEREKLIKRCAEVKDYKKTLDRSAAIYDLDENGERVDLSTEEKDAELGKVNEFIKKNC